MMLLNWIIFLIQTFDSVSPIQLHLVVFVYDFESLLQTMLLSQEIAALSFFQLNPNFRGDQALPR